MSQNLLKPLYGIIAFILFLHLLIYIGFAVALIPFPYDYDQAEGFELNNAVLLANGGCPYCSNEEYPFFASGYPPLFHLLMVPFVWLFGPALWYGRLIIFASTLITSGAIAWAVWKSENHTWVAIFAGIAFIASNYIYHIGPLLRQHLLMVMFETVAVVLAAVSVSAANKIPRSRLYLILFLLLLAGYTKQLAYSTVIAILLWLFLRNPRRSIHAGILLGFAALLIFVVALLLTNGEWWLNIIVSNQNEYIPEQFTGLFRQFVQLHWALLLPSLLMVIYELYFSRISIFSIWFVASLISTIGAGKWGAGDSYFATTIAAMCILTGIFISRSVQGTWSLRSNYLVPILRRLSPLRHVVPVLSLLLLFIYAITVFKMPTSGPIFGPIAELFHIEPKPGHRYAFYDSADWTVGYAVTGHFPTLEDYRNGAEILQYIISADGPVMSEDAAFALLAGQDVISNPIQLKNLWDNGKYDPSSLLDLIENHYFRVIVRRGDFFPTPVLNAIDTYYRLDISIPMNGFSYQLWIPDDPA